MTVKVFLHQVLRLVITLIFLVTCVDSQACTRKPLNYNACEIVTYDGQKPSRSNLTFGVPDYSFYFKPGEDFDVLKIKIIMRTWFYVQTFGTFLADGHVLCEPRKWYYI